MSWLSESEAYVQIRTAGVGESMLEDAIHTGRQLSGSASMWQNPFGTPDPRAAVRTAAVWFTAYPAALVNAPGSSFVATLADADLWKAFSAIGIQAVHTGPVKTADGWYVRIFTESGFLDPAKPIRISVQSGNVELYGVVDSQSDKDTAYIRANSVPGVFSVKNYLQVAGQPVEAQK